MWSGLVSRIGGNRWALMGLTPVIADSGSNQCTDCLAAISALGFSCSTTSPGTGLADWILIDVCSDTRRMLFIPGQTDQLPE